MLSSEEQQSEWAATLKLGRGEGIWRKGATKAQAGGRALPLVAQGSLFRLGAPKCRPASLKLEIPQGKTSSYDRLLCSGLSLLFWVEAASSTLEPVRVWGT